LFLAVGKKTVELDGSSSDVGYLVNVVMKSLGILYGKSNSVIPIV